MSPDEVGKSAKRVERGGNTAVMYVCAECGADHFVNEPTVLGHLVKEIRCVECNHMIREAGEI